MPGEAQKVDLILDQFSTIYIDQNPNIYPDEDTVFIFSFAAIMLNTDLHNTRILSKQTKQQFQRNCAGTWGGGDAPDGFTDTLYDEVKENPISLDPGKVWLGRLTLSYSLLGLFSSNHVCHCEIFEKGLIKAKPQGGSLFTIELKDILAEASKKTITLKRSKKGEQITFLKDTETLQRPKIKLVFENDKSCADCIKHIKKCTRK
mmetsp:Transcript_5137/g.5587  ORF Transcript_5137/g.5587 Transcript_5137/m.5587 type:complete len:204 (+) Transcript_5137:94-705(+)